MEALAARLESTVKEVEAKSAAEVVVVLAARSGETPDLPWKVGAAAGWFALAFLAWSPWTFHGYWFPVDAALVGGLAGWLGGRAPAVYRALVRPERRKAAVKLAAEAAFVQEAVHATRARTGILFYVSRLEGEVVVLPDQGVYSRVPPAELATLRVDGSSEEATVASLQALGALLARHLPADEADNPDEIPDAPRVRR